MFYNSPYLSQRIYVVRATYVLLLIIFTYSYYAINATYRLITNQSLLLLRHLPTVVYQCAKQFFKMVDARTVK